MRSSFDMPTSIVALGLGLVLFGLMASATNTAYSMFFGDDITSVATYTQSLMPGWPIKTSLAGLLVEMVGVLMLCIKQWLTTSAGLKTARQ